jgi:hypothetical protein
VSPEVALPNPVAFGGAAYRNIYTIKESQNLFDDLISDPTKGAILQTWDNESSGIDHTTPQKNRPFQYASISTIDALIDPGRWVQSRFSDGTFGVWYGALEEDTSVKEALYHAYRFAREDFAPEKFPIIVERKMFLAELNAVKAVDIRGVNPPEELVSNDYTFCQNLGMRAHKAGYSMYLSPSARHAKGTCTPVFEAAVILKDSPLYFLKFSFIGPDEVRITRDVDEVSQIPETWK